MVLYIFEFEGSEQPIKDLFVDCILTEDVTDSIVEAIFNAILSYNHITERIEVKE